MEKILVVLIIILVIMIALLAFITIRNKKKNIDIEEDFLEEEVPKNIPEIKIPEVKEEIHLPKEEKSVEVIENIFDGFDNHYRENIEEEIEKIDIENEVTQIIDLMQVNSKSLSEKVSDYEDEQEENAIISYTELLNAVKNKKEVQEELKFDDYKEIKEEVFIEEPRQNNYSENKKFRNSEAISPLGRINKNDNEESYKSDIKNTNMYKDANNTDDFLKSLKDFRDTL